MPSSWSRAAACACAPRPSAIRPRPSPSSPALPSSCGVTAWSWTRRSWCSMPAAVRAARSSSAGSVRGTTRATRGGWGARGWREGRSGTAAGSRALVGSAALVASDLLYLEGASLAARPFGERRGELAALLAPSRGALPAAASWATARPLRRRSARSASAPSPPAGSARPSAPVPPAMPGTACRSWRRPASSRRCSPSSAGCPVSVASTDGEPRPRDAARSISCET